MVFCWAWSSCVFRSSCYWANAHQRWSFWWWFCRRFCAWMPTSIGSWRTIWSRISNQNSSWCLLSWIRRDEADEPPATGLGVVASIACDAAASLPQEDAQSMFQGSFHQGGTIGRLGGTAAPEKKAPKHGRGKHSRTGKDVLFEFCLRQGLQPRQNWTWKWFESYLVVQGLRKISIWKILTA